MRRDRRLSRREVGGGCVRVVERTARSRGDEAGGAFAWALPSSVARESCAVQLATGKVRGRVIIAYSIHVPLTRLPIDGCPEQLGLRANADSVADFVDTHLFQCSRIHVHKVFAGDIITCMPISPERQHAQDWKEASLLLKMSTY